jgi:hypothetical protein
MKGLPPSPTFISRLQDFFRKSLHEFRISFLRQQRLFSFRKRAARELFDRAQIEKQPLNASIIARGARLAKRLALFLDGPMRDPND